MFMDFGLGNHLAGIRHCVSERVRGLRKNDPAEKRMSRFTLKLPPRLSPRLKGAAFGGTFILIAAFLAWNAQELTYSHALSDWERSRLPSDRTWAYSLERYGWSTPPAASKTAHQALKKLPASYDSAGSVWASPTLDWIIVFSDPSQVVSQKVFCHDCKKLPERWEPLGTGWTAFDQVLARLEKIQATSRVTQKVRKTIKFVDSREIHY
jgi:hypothetical protein